jgi:hypothetical protein
VAACSSDDNAPAGGGGGTSGSGGSVGSGGSSGSGGSGGLAGSGGAGGSTGSGGTAGAPDAGRTDAADSGVSPNFSFFVTSTGSGAQGGALGGLDGADTKCQTLATGVGAGGKTWRAYLSISAGGPDGGSVNARDRIGAGPWYNVRGALIATDVATLHEEGEAGMNGLTGATGLDEHGSPVPTGGDSGTNQHDILTGSMADGRAFPAVPDFTCAGWTSSQAGPAPAPPPSDAAAGDASDAAVEAAAEAAVDAALSDGADAAPAPRAFVGHVNRTGTNAPPANASWNSSHATPGCAQADLTRVGGAGRLYCFAVTN